MSLILMQIITICEINGRNKWFLASVRFHPLVSSLLVFLLTFHGDVFCVHGCSLTGRQNFLEFLSRATSITDVSFYTGYAVLKEGTVGELQNTVLSLITISVVPGQDSSTAPSSAHRQNGFAPHFENFMLSISALYARHVIMIDKVSRNTDYYLRY